MSSNRRPISRPRPVAAAALLLALLAAAAHPLLAQAPKREYRSFDGSGNNKTNPSLGAAGTPYARSVSASLDFNASSLAGLRVLSNTLARSEKDIRNARRLSVLHTFWGEFFIHDVAHVVSSSDPADRYSVPVPADDKFLPPGSNMSFSRAVAAGQGVRRIPINVQSHFLDGSHLYGTTPEQVAALRDGPLFKLEPSTYSDYSPTVSRNPRGTNVTQSTLPPGQEQMFAFGSIVGNTSPYSQALYTLFMREHNRFANAYRAKNPGVSDDDLFQEARMHVIALIQHITYYEYLPLLLGFSLDAYTKYDPKAVPLIESSFASTTYRFGHSEIPAFLTYIDDKTNTTVQVDMAANFFRSDLVKSVGIGALFAGMSSQIQDEADIYYTEPMRSQVFGPRLAKDGFVFDLFRARDYLIPGYAQMRQSMALSAPKTFADIHPDFADVLAKAYASVDDVDALVGGLLERRDMYESNVGPMFSRSIVNQFKALRDGDRFWFENPGVMRAEHLAEIRNTSLRQIIMRNVKQSTRTFPNNIWQVVPDPPPLDAATAGGRVPGFTFSHELAPGFRVSWNIRNRDKADESVHCLLQCAYAGYCAIGFGGSSMITATEMYIARSQQGGKNITLTEYKPTGAYTRPSPATVRANTAITVLSTKSLGDTGAFQVEFLRRNLQPGKVAVKNAKIPIIFSYSISASAQIQFHGANRGQAAVNFFTSDVDDDRLESSPALMAHAITMLVVFGFAFPLAVAIARYCRTRDGWVVAHVGLQTLSCVAVIVAGALAISVSVLGTSTHEYIGLFVFTAVIAQMIIGFGNLGRLLASSKSRWVRGLKFAHNYFGRAIVVAGFVNMPFGINVAYPVSGIESILASPFWIAYLALTSFWILFFAVMEFRRLRAASRGSPLGAAPLVGNKLDTRKFAAEQIVIKRTDLPAVTWREVDEQVVAGRMWVVGNGFVYDVSKWIISHPGGQQVLYNVLGTDITMDYFNSALYDADLFVPWTDVPVVDYSDPKGPALAPGAARRNSVGVRKSPNTLTAPGSNAAGLRSRCAAATAGGGSRGGGDTLGVPDAKGAPLGGGGPSRPASECEKSGICDRDVEADARILMEDWRMIVEARNQHFHSAQAIDKLKDLVVAKLDTGDDEPKFVKNEYRRYALTAKELLSNENADAEVFRLKFCLLYPNEVYAEEPLFFLPGQAIELQVRIRGKFVSRYYTPVSGNMAVFDMVVKCLPDGAMSRVWRTAQPGEAQYKIRGPFGSPLMNPSRPLPMSNGCWDEILLIGVGSGATPHLQLVSWYFLQTTFSLRPSAANVPAKANELAVQRDEKVFIRHPLQNGWVYATNAHTGQDGIIHLSKLSPWIGRRPKVTVINAARNMDSLIGSDTLEAIAAAYPDQVKLVYVLSREAPSSPGGPACRAIEKHAGRVDRALLRDLLERSKWVASGEAGRSQRVVLCGPEKFMDETYRTLVDLGVVEDDIIALPAHSYLVNPHPRWRALNYANSIKTLRSQTNTNVSTTMASSFSGTLVSSSGVGLAAAAAAVPPPVHTVGSDQTLPMSVSPSSGIAGLGAGANSRDSLYRRSFAPIAGRSTPRHGGGSSETLAPPTDPTSAAAASAKPPKPAQRLSSARWTGKPTQEIYDAGRLTDSDDDGESGGGFMSADDYAKRLPPATRLPIMPLRTNPKSNEPEWFYLPPSTASRRSFSMPSVDAPRRGSGS
ncbi:DOMON domain-containing protein frrs1L [Blastocladiella emersonii ATCC 22665]|nr:DOMON domain-containing protein frrs1L [Blastocladiella emersonii ATCC 22665]